MSLDRAIKFQNLLPELNINVLDEYLNIFKIYNAGIFINSLTNCKTRKYTLEDRKKENTRNLLKEQKIIEFNSNCPFNLYIIDTFYKYFAVLTIDKVYQKYNDILIEEQKLIPSCLKDFYAYSYYKFSNIQILPYETSSAVININSKTPLFDVKQINPNSPWYVEQLEGLFANLLIENCPDTNIIDIGYHPNYSIYRFYINLPAGQMSYIGLTCQMDVRYNHHKNPKSWNSKNEKEKFLYMAFKNVGFDKFQFEVLHDNLTEEEAHFWEATEIKNYNAYYPFGFNVRNEDKYLA